MPTSSLLSACLASLRATACLLLHVDLRVAPLCDCQRVAGNSARARRAVAVESERGSGTVERVRPAIGRRLCRDRGAIRDPDGRRLRERAAGVHDELVARDLELRTRGLE